MAIWYIDYVNGNDANDGLGWWRAAFTSGGTHTVLVGDTLTGHTSGQTGIVDEITVSSGSWGAGNAAGFLYIHGKSGAFTPGETLDEGVNIDVATLTADFAYSSFKQKGNPTGVAAGDEFRIAKSPDPTLVGNAAWTQDNRQIVLAGAHTLNIDMCDTLWSSGTNATASIETTIKKEGTGSMKVVTNAGHVAAGQLAYLGITEAVLSGHKQISFMFRNETSAITAGLLQIKLYSDLACTAEVESFDIPLLATTARFHPITVNKGSAMAASVKGIALYATAGMASKTFYLDCVIACLDATSADSLTLQSLISKNSAAQGGTEPWFAIKFINGTTLELDQYAGVYAGLGATYAGETAAAAATYKRECIIAASADNAILSPTSGTTLTAPTKYWGGFNPATGSQDGESFYDWIYDFGSAHFGIGSFLNILCTSLNRLNPVRGRRPLSWYQSGFSEVKNMFAVNTAEGIALGYAGGGAKYGTIIIAMGAGAWNLQGDVEYVRCWGCAVSYGGSVVFYGVVQDFDIRQNIGSSGCGAGFNSTGVAYSGHTRGNQRGIISAPYCASGYMKNVNVEEATECDTSEAGKEAFCFSSNHDLIPNNDWMFTYGGSANKQNTVYNSSRHSSAEAATADGDVNKLTLVDTSLVGFANDYFNGGTITITSGASNGDVRTITDYVASTGTFTVSAVFTAQIVSGVTYTLTVAFAWRLRPTSAYRDTSYPVAVPVAQILCEAGVAVTVSAYLRRSHTSLNMGLRIVKGQLAGLTTTIDQLMTDIADTWEKVTLASFTPTETGVVEIQAIAYGGTTYSGYVDDIEVVV